MCVLNSETNEVPPPLPIHVILTGYVPEVQIASHDQQSSHEVSIYSLLSLYFFVTCPCTYVRMCCNSYKYMSVWGAPTNPSDVYAVAGRE